MILSSLVSNFLSYSGNLNREERKSILKFGNPTIALPLAIKKCTVQTGCTVGKGSFWGRSQSVLQITSLNTLVDVIGVPKNTYTSGE